MDLETQGWRGVARSEWATPPHGAVMRSQSKLLLRAVSGSVAMQRLGLVWCPWLILPLENMGTFLVGAAAGTMGMSKVI